MLSISMIFRRVFCFIEHAKLFCVYPWLESVLLQTLTISLCYLVICYLLSSFYIVLSIYLHCAYLWFDCVLTVQH